jgi:hypothetical protein
MPKAVWELFCISWQQSLCFSQKVRDQLLIGLVNPFYRKVANRVFDSGIELLSKFFAQMQGDPLAAFSEGMKLDFHSINGMITLARKLPSFLLRIEA